MSSYDRALVRKGKAIQYFYTLKITDCEYLVKEDSIAPSIKKITYEIMDNRVSYYRLHHTAVHHIAEEEEE